MYDAYLQAAFMVSDPKKQKERAQQYFDFAIIDRHELQQRVLKMNNSFGNALKARPRRSEGEKGLKEKYDRVKTPFLKRDGKTRDKWYECNAGTLADVAKRKEEYQVFLFALHPCVHSAASAIAYHPMITPGNLDSTSTALVARVALLIIRHNNLNASKEEMEALEACEEDTLNLPDFPSAEISAQASANR